MGRLSCLILLDATKVNFETVIEGLGNRLILVVCPVVACGKLCEVCEALQLLLDVRSAQQF